MVQRNGSRHHLNVHVYLDIRSADDEICKAGYRNTDIREIIGRSPEMEEGRCISSLQIAVISFPHVRDHMTNVWSSL